MLMMGVDVHIECLLDLRRRSPCTVEDSVAMSLAHAITLDLTDARIKLAIVVYHVLWDQRPPASVSIDHLYTRGAAVHDAVWTVIDQANCTVLVVSRWQTGRGSAVLHVVP